MAEVEVRDAPEEGNTLTLLDVLEEELQLENDANAVLGPADDKNCTYNLGYVQRQALYACKTCAPTLNGEPASAGICLACSYHCHEGHDLVELYTKRLFRCDCGNPKFNGKKCNLIPEKTELNEMNSYNHNFQGLYCICARPYPDPEDEISDEMLQCAVCEDWYHSRHLNSEVPSGENYAELICGPCSDKLPFLNYYHGLSITKIDNSAKADSDSKVEENVTITESFPKVDDVPGVSGDNGVKSTPADPKCEETSKINDPPAEASPVKTSDECLLKSMVPLPRNSQGATFWPGNFRSSLCVCPECKETYTKLNVPWITDENDTVQAYEEKGIKGAENGPKPSQYEQGMRALSQMDRVSQVEAIQNYNDLKSNLCTYLTKFAQTKRVVTEDDIHEFFNQMQARKRQRVGTPQYMCH